MNRLRADLLLLAAAAIWGLAFVFQKTAMASLGPFAFMAARGTVAALALAPFAMLEGRWSHQLSAALRPPSWRGPGGLLAAGIQAGLAFAVACALQQFGLLTATASNGGFLTALYVVVIPALAWLLDGTRPGPVLVPAVALSISGTWLLGGGAFAALSSGDWLIVACALFWALHVLLSERGAAFDRPVLFTCVQFAVVALVGWAGAALFETPSVAAMWAASGEILYVGLLSSALTFTILTLALKHAPASEAAVIVSTESLFAAIAGALLLGEHLTPLAWVGAALIMAAVILVQVGPRTRRPQVVEPG